MRAAVVLVVACASSFSFLLGYDIGIMSGAKRLIKIDLGLSEGDVELLVGILNLVSGPGGLLSGRLADTMGRRAAAAIACAITLVGALTMAAAQSFAVLLTGRVVTGIGVGCCFHIAPLYIAEVAPKHVRGRLMSFFDLSINVGILAGYLVGWALTPRATRDTAGGAAGAAWRTMLALGAIPPALNLLALLRLPESPQYLVAAGREREAADVLSLVYHPAEASATLDLLRSERRGNKPLNLCAGLRRVLLPARGAPGVRSSWRASAAPSGSRRRAWRPQCTTRRRRSRPPVSPTSATCSSRRSASASSRWDSSSSRRLSSSRPAASR